MRPFSIRAAGLLALGAIAACPRAATAQQQPESTISKFPHLPSKILYFEDTESVLYHDPLLQNVYRSDNEGKSWQLVDNVPDGDASQLIEHPSDNSVAFILTRTETHWITYNRGSTWQQFSVPNATPSFMSSPLTFHATEKGWILYQGTICEDNKSGGWGGQKCWDETFYTKDAFRTAPLTLLSETTQCSFAHQSKDFISDAPAETNSLIFCIAFSPLEGSGSKGDAHSIAESRLYKSDNWFGSMELVDFSVGKESSGVVGLGVVSKFVVAALRADVTGGGGTGGGGGDPMNMFVTSDGKTWAKAKFPHSSTPALKENAYTIVESTKHSLAIDVLVHPTAAVGDLFVSNSNGTEFSISLQDTNRNQRGIVDFENLVGLDGIGIANVVSNREEVVGWGKDKEIKSKVTFNDGRTWGDLQPPARKANGDDWACDLRDPAKCSLHLHSVSTPHNYGKVFSSTAPGYVMGVGSVGAFLMPYDDCDTFISHDAGVSWHMAFTDAAKYEFGDQGSIIVAVNDEGPTDTIKYSWDAGKTWDEYKIGVTLRALLLTTVPDSTSQKFLLLGSMSRKDAGDGDRHATVFLDFAPIRKRQCGASDLEKWYARPTGQECLMGHKQWYQRKKLNADCYVGHKFEDPVGMEEDCPCADIDFECDFNFVLQDGECVLAGPEPVPAGTCTRPTDTFKGSSGYRLIPGNTCNRANGIKKDEPTRKSCEQARPADGSVSHQTQYFDSKVVQHFYFGDSQTVVVQLADNSIWQSSNQGFAWKRLYENERFLAMALHAHASDRAYLITDSRKVFYTTDTGKNWYTFAPPTDPNGLNIPIFEFHPLKSDWLIWTGQVDCGAMSSTSCRAVSHYTTNNGRSWKQIESYVKSCSWAKVHRSSVDERMILCEAYTKKSGSQRAATWSTKSLTVGQDYYSKKTEAFPTIVGYTTFSEYLIVAELNEDRGTLRLQVSLDGVHFAEGQFPPGLGIENKAYTVLESSTDSVFLHVTTSSKEGDEFGSIFKSNSNGTYYGVSIDHVNRNGRGYVDFEKMIGLDGVAVVNVVSNPDEAAVNGRKKLQTRITHNDGGSWKPMTPPARDSLGQSYGCTSTACSLQIHGYTARRDPKATYSSPSAAGLMMAVGNVGEELAGYTESDTFLTRDAGFTWEEVHKDAHLWEFGDYGSIIVLVNDEVPTSEILYTTNEGLSWNTYDFGETLNVVSIQTVPSDTSRKFLVFGSRPRKNEETVAVYVDFSALTTRKCEQKMDDPNHDDFELWSPAESREETCLFGRQTMFHRRIRDRDCFVGEAPNLQDRYKFVKNCTCTASDFECEFNYQRDAAGNCVLFPGATPLSPLSTEEEQCGAWPGDVWYERTNVRKIPFSSCEGGARPDRGKKHDCPNVFVGNAKSWLFWATAIASPFLVAALMGAWWVRKRMGPINLGGESGGAFGGPAALGALDILASIPYFVIGASGAALAWAEDHFNRLGFVERMRAKRGYRTVAVDDDAEILRNTYDED